MRFAKPLLALLVAFVASSTFAVEPVNKTRQGVSIDGYDPVAYFVEGKPVKGSAQYFDGQSRHLRTLSEGECFGEMSLLTGKPRIATVIAAENSELMELSRDALESVIAKYPRIQRVLETFAQQREKGLK